ncbi:hypothetical protein CK203_087975 [Vitis vinifera]|uniref:Reverse transcriptase RNase H-like domain-containing protein n=1 Tax=Vitis vinifera TaxID=29760 RepID=A0A438D7W1_VITVI|nr:hypothetical protein CK203_087975 [Vitis vinifera]
MYLAVSEWAISAVLFRCPSPKEQKPIYYVSRALADVETRYSKMELTALALRSAAQKLRPYFQAHPVIVLTDQPLRNILHKPDLTGRMLQWAIELSEFGIEFQPRLSMKGQVMADFVLEYSRRPSQHHESSKQEWWTLRVDGASRSSGSGVGLLLQSPTGNIWSKPSGWDSLPLTMKQNMRPSCPDWTSPLLYPSPNSGSTATHNSWQTKRTIKNGRMTSQNISGQELYPEIQTGTQSPGASCPFHPDWGHLYKRSFTGPYLRCLGHSEAQYVLAELHEGICGNHSEDDLWHIELIRKDYWPTMKKTQLCQKCDKCQRSHKQTLITALKKRLEQAKGKWVEELPGVLWAYRTTPGRPTGNTPFALAYGMDAVIPTEIGLPTIRTDAAKQNDAKRN